MAKKSSSPKKGNEVRDEEEVEAQDRAPRPRDGPGSHEAQVDNAPLPRGVDMREGQHDAEPWIQEGCRVLNARRIVAAVNAVEGIPAPALEGGVVVKELLAMARAPGSDLRNAESRLRAEIERSRNGWKE